MEVRKTAPAFMAWTCHIKFGLPENIFLRNEDFRTTTKYWTYPEKMFFPCTKLKATCLPILRTCLICSFKSWFTHVTMPEVTTARSVSNSVERRLSRRRRYWSNNPLTTFLALVRGVFRVDLVYVPMQQCQRLYIYNSAISVQFGRVAIVKKTTLLK